ncbi:IQ motif and SEC7 domain-containing protein 3 isoform X1 [Hemibagrus wyckioides]|uniref:IQ motif and SEC7 domain-containing protein 3 isoform X1 n=1 Tax=Hemibagrus wyckioides TaxID=337641 RepID=UPI00266B41BB|nr:IQ motif and SEC7 domain-containing protein 3 isoform X1 [Hemibagrus wyckioides]
MSSLLENPLQAVLYLKELTTIVQNQQGLIQTQRRRIDTLERKLKELAGENRRLHDATHRHPSRPHPPPRTSSALANRDGTPPPPLRTPTTQTERHSPQDMQLVPAVPSGASMDSSTEDTDADTRCRSLVPQMSTALCRTGPRNSESQTVLHQFCCPAPEAPEGDPTGCSRRSVHPVEREEEKDQKDAPCLSPTSCSHTPDYELSPDLKQKQIEDLEQKYGGALISRRAACKIQTAFRQYQLSKNFQKIRNSVLESGIPRRMSMRRVRVQRDGFSAERALMEGCTLMGIPLTHSSSLPTGAANTLTNLEDTFSEQVQSLARSIDEALSSWTSVRDGEGAGTSVTKPSGSVTEGLLMDATTLQEATQNTCSENIPRSASKLMMAFRDVTVQIDNHNFHLSSSVLESVSLGNGISKETATEPQARVQSGGQNESSTTAEAEFPAPPPSEEIALDQRPAGDEAESAQSAWEKPLTNQSASENSSEPISSSSTSTSACENMIISLPRTHCPDTHCGTLSTDVARKRLYRIGLNLFNINPDKGIQFLISRGFIPDTAIGVAHFLLQRKGLSRQMIGEFLGNSKRQFNRDVLDCVVDEMDFSMLELDEALRKFQAHVRVQGEAQKVERLIEAFSQRYCMCNPDVVQQFHNPDTIFILAFAIVLLNTDMYSPNIKPERKMLLEDFIRNLRGVDDGADIPREMVAGIYERIQQRELRSNEDHVTYVTRVEQSIQGMKTILSMPHRRLVCCSRLYEVSDVNKPQKQAAHQREVFLFNDLIVILKLCPKKKSVATYVFCKAMGLLGMQFHMFENEYYPHGITILSPFSSEKKQVVNFCSQNLEELLKFVEDLRESIAEVAEMEQIRIEWELERQQATRTPAQNNGSQLEMHSRPISPAGDHDFYDKTGSNAVEVSIHHRLRTYQVSTPPAPPTSQPQLAIMPSPASSSVLNISPDTLIQCQQIDKVIVMDSAGRGHVETFLSQNPGQRLIQSAVSTPTRTREGGAKQPPLPPPPPPYHHKHQFCPPTPPPPQHLLSQRRYSSGTRSLV